MGVGGDFQCFLSTLGCNRNRIPLLSKASNIVQNIFYLYDVTGFTQLWHSIPVATKCIVAVRARQKSSLGYHSYADASSADSFTPPVLGVYLFGCRAKPWRKPSKPSAALCSLAILSLSPGTLDVILTGKSLRHTRLVRRQLHATGAGRVLVRVPRKAMAQAQQTLGSTLQPGHLVLVSRDLGRDLHHRFFRRDGATRPALCRLSRLNHLSRRVRDLLQLRVPPRAPRDAEYVVEALHLPVQVPRAPVGVAVVVAAAEAAELDAGPLRREVAHDVRSRLLARHLLFLDVLLYSVQELGPGRRREGTAAAAGRFLGGNRGGHGGADWEMFGEIL